MGTGGTPWRGTVLGLVLLTGALATGCGESGPPGGTASARAASGGAPTSPSATPPEDLCARIVAHWSREVMQGDTYGDYQSMGLSNGQYEILMDVVDRARAEQKRSGERAAQELIDRSARERCTERYRDGDPTGGPWS
ncbi:hypothetical protein [Streptomyces sp. NBC_00878]|uniref:hypothetical protein n=1 Tax=Streptomyces sp. NBC_00878 TaxID=2975854 RepID=UPI00224EF2B7|nr:hypothetical protein [Streptomyces sp. NBC_00878]MCX4909522.1 hypothetical protein [Streptomyces sp. NBC_00878]